MVEKTAEKVESQVRQPAADKPALSVSNEQFREAQANRLDNRENVVENGQLKFTALYGPQGVSPEIAKPLAGATPKDQGLTSDRAVVAPTGDNTGAITDKGAPINPADVQVQKTRLEALTKGMSPDQAAEVQKDLQAIENRKPPLTADQVNKIYDSTSRLIEDPNHTSPLSQAERNQLAAGILHNASLRTGTDQGFHNTCNVTTLERRLNTINPAEAARIVSEVGLTGQYKSSDGQMIKLDAASLHADSEASLRFGDARCDGKRDYASQIFDQATINDYWQHQKPPLFYSQVAPTSQSDTGERLKYGDGREVMGPDGKPMRQPALSADAMADIGKRLGFTGNYIIANSAVAGSENTDGTNKINSYQQFADALTSGKPPSIILVNANDKLFGGNGDKGGSGGWHVVTASDYQAGPPPRVFMTNQWGSENNKWVNLSDLYNATLPSNAGRVDDGGRDQGRGDQGRGDQGRGDQGRGDQGGGNQGGNDHRGWSRNDGVMRDEDYRKWRQDLFDQEYPKKDQDPKKQNTKPNPIEQIAPLQSMLEEARAKNDPFTMSLIRHRIQDLLNSQ